ncbi:RNA-directed DNA polymerase, eukaryota, reverse transcriptase zinc-binding domain protein [Tanacetum coccineum]
MKDGVNDNHEDEDMIEEVSEIANNMKVNDVQGLSSSEKQKEVVNFIREERLHVCTILETHLKSKKIIKVSERIYDEVRMSVIHMARQSILVQVETRNNMKLYGTFINASNGGMERKKLWKDLEIYKRIVGKEPWFLSGDMNVTLAPNEHSVGEVDEGCKMLRTVKNLRNLKKHMRKLACVTPPNFTAAEDWIWDYDFMA